MYIKNTAKMEIKLSIIHSISGNSMIDGSGMFTEQH